MPKWKCGITFIVDGRNYFHILLLLRIKIENKVTFAKRDLPNTAESSNISKFQVVNKFACSKIETRKPYCQRRIAPQWSQKLSQIHLVVLREIDWHAESTKFRSWNQEFCQKNNQTCAFFSMIHSKRAVFRSQKSF